MQDVDGDVQNTAFQMAESLAALARDTDAMQQLYRVAESCGRLPRDSFLARELVNDVLGDVLMGDVMCDPECNAASQIERHVRRRGHRLRLRKANAATRNKRGLAFELIPLDKAPASALVVEPLQTLIASGEHSEVDAAQLLSAIRARAVDDGPALQLLALYDQGLVLRRDVLGAGMTEWGYRAARERLCGYAKVAYAALSRGDLDDGKAAPSAV